MCPQTIPLWLHGTSEYAKDYYGHGSPSLETYEAEQALAKKVPETMLQSLMAQRLGKGTEDCLFLDVVTPKRVFDKASGDGRNRGAGLIVYIHGGGFQMGDKAQMEPDSFLLRAYEKGSDGIVRVALKYRLGALGFLAGPMLQANGGVSNAGFYDQQLAIECVYQNIYKFGRDPEKITLFGESAGGASILHHITAPHDERFPTRFKKAIGEYPGFEPQPSQKVQNNRTADFLALLDTATIAGARNASSARVIKANFQAIALTPPGVYAFGPAVDKAFVPALPSQPLLAGAHAKNISILASYNTNDGARFTPPERVDRRALRRTHQTRYTHHRFRCTQQDRDRSVPVHLQRKPALHHTVRARSALRPQLCLLVQRPVPQRHVHYPRVGLRVSSAARAAQVEQGEYHVDRPGQRDGLADMESGFAGVCG